jgi:hypothetical protein
MIGRSPWINIDGGGIPQFLPPPVRIVQVSGWFKEHVSPSSVAAFRRQVEALELVTARESDSAHNPSWGIVRGNGWQDTARYLGVANPIVDVR